MLVQKEYIGNHIRRLRRLQYQTLQNVADRCGFTKSLLSKIEGGRVVPPMSTLVKIACALNTNIASLMADGEAVDCVFIPAKHNGVEPTPTVNGYRILPLAVEFKQKKMQPFLFTVRSDELQDKANSHTGEEFIYVLEGGIEFRVREQTYTLRVGDSLFFNSIEEHFISKVLTTQAVYLNIFN